MAIVNTVQSPGSQHARIGFLTVSPGPDLKNDKRQLEFAIEQLEQQAKQRIEAAGLVLLGVPMAMVVEGTAITLDDERVKQDYTWGPSVGIFIEVHIGNPAVASDEL